MPRFDRTGPEGKGSRTGRAMGKCNPNAVNPERNDEPLSGRGMGNGSAKGLGRGLGKGIGRRLRLGW